MGEIWRIRPRTSKNTTSRGIRVFFIQKTWGRGGRERKAMAAVSGRWVRPCNPWRFSWSVQANSTTSKRWGPISTSRKISPDTPGTALQRQKRRKISIVFLIIGVL